MNFQSRNGLKAAYHMGVIDRGDDRELPDFYDALIEDLKRRQADEDDNERLSLNANGYDND